jgi:hypothetical protein
MCVFFHMNIMLIYELYADATNINIITQEIIKSNS